MGFEVCVVGKTAFRVTTISCGLAGGEGQFALPVRGESVSGVS